MNGDNQPIKPDETMEGRSFPVRKAVVAGVAAAGLAATGAAALNDSPNTEQIKTVGEPSPDHNPEASDPSTEITVTTEAPTEEQAPPDTLVPNTPGEDTDVTNPAMP